MSTGNRGGFSLVEALVAVAITGVGVTAALGGLKALAHAETDARQMELMSSLATEKYDEVMATHEYTAAPLSGDFRDRNIEGYTYKVETEPSATENLEILRVTVQPEDQSSTQMGRATGLVFIPPTPTQGGQ